jgi:hypothetical protein
MNREVGTIPGRDHALSIERIPDYTCGLTHVERNQRFRDWASAGIALAAIQTQLGGGQAVEIRFLNPLAKVGREESCRYGSEAIL